VAARLPGGQVIVAGDRHGGYMAMSSAELWGPATGAWAALPLMTQRRYVAAGYVLPSGRFAVFGSYGREDAEAFDPVSRAWEPLPPCRTAW
jgi:hypothetical protein